MPSRFLVDACLSVTLPDLARAAGFEAMHLRDLGRTNEKDWDLTPFIAEGGWTFVTRNAKDFRGRKDMPGTKGQYTRLERHEGLVCLNGPDGMDLHMHRELFQAVLDHIADAEQDARGDDLAGQVVEATIHDLDANAIEIRRYDLPDGSWGLPQARLNVARGTSADEGHGGQG
jgi:hypothetical protein